MTIWFLRIAVFICGASVMVVEIVGSRLLAPYVGGSLIVWTTLIGIIMAALSAGYWLGGRLADRAATFSIFGWLIFLAAVLVGMLPWLNQLSRGLSGLLLPQFGLSTTAIIISCFLFVLPGIVLGMISPYALRLALHTIEAAGRTAGSLYALSTIGSIVGTFIAGFWLIPALGSIKTLAVVSIVLVLTSCLFWRFKAAFILLVFLTNAGIIFLYPQIFRAYPQALEDIESSYNRLFIIPAVDARTNRPTINIMTGPRIAQSGRFTDADDDLVYEYTKFFRLADDVNLNINRGLMIGAGAYTVPKDFLKRHPQASLDVVEIDPLYTDIARRYFNLADDERMHIYHEDARIFLNNERNAYDVVYIDAFNGAGSVPFHLTTQEAVRRLQMNMADNGVVVVNLIGSIRGVGSDFIRAEYATYQSVFKSVKLFPLGGPADQLQNIILMAKNNDVWPTSAALTNKELKNFSPASRILTDDWAPVDYFLASVL